MKRFLPIAIVLFVAMMIVGCGRHSRHHYSDNTSTAITIFVGVPVTGYVDGLGDADWYCLDLEQGQSYCFETLNLGVDVDTVLTLVDETRLGVIAENDDVDDESVRSKFCVTADYTGQHYLIVSFKDGESGIYDLVVTDQLPDDDSDDDDDDCEHGRGTEPCPPPGH